jgi:hypothetical protein
MRIRVFILLWCIMSFGATRARAQGRTFYIDYAAGSNSNTGTKASPWKTHPYMQAGASCTGTGSAPSYSHVAGDQFIFKGGVTWPLACFLMTISNGGTSGNPDYYGVDKTWYTGGSWMRPIFDMANGTPTGGQGNILKIPAAWVVVDDIEMKRNLIIAYTADCADATIDASGGGNVTIENSYIHDWTITAFGASSGTGSSTGHGTGSICQNATSNVDAIGNTMTDLSTTAAVPFGACFRNLSITENNDCEHTGEGEVGHGQVDGNVFANINGVAVQIAEGNNQYINHTNIIEGSVNGGSVYNNVLHDNAAGVSILECNGANIYNNVIWNNANDYAISVDTNCAGATSSTVANVYNNTVECATNTACFGYIYRAGGTPGILNLRNNQWISNSPSVCYNNPPTCSNTTGGTQIPNTPMSTATAAAQGYSAGSNYAPTSSSGATIHAGANLTSQCTGALTSLCLDASGAPWKGGSYVSRPTGSTAWDSGAYQFTGGSTGPPVVTMTSPSPGNVSGTVTLTATATPQGSATITSCQFTIDGFPFGAPDTLSPYTITWDSNSASNARAHAVSANCTDSNSNVGPAASVSVTPTNTHSSGFVSDSLWAPSIPSQSFTPQTSGTVTYPVCIKPYTSTNSDNEVGLSQALPTGYGDFAAIIAIRAGGYIQAYDGSGAGYAAIPTATSYPVSAGTTYCFDWTINMATSQYSVAETSPSVATIATNYGFRAAATSIGFLSAFATNDSTPDTVEVSNFGSVPTLSYSPGDFNFGAVVNTMTSTLTESVTIANGPATISSAAVSGTGFSLNGTGTCPTSGSLSVACTYKVDFTPPSTGSYTGTLTITSNATGSPQVINLSGSGIASSATFSLNQNVLGFGEFQIYGTVANGPIVITVANGPSTGSSYTITGANASDFFPAANTWVGSVASQGQMVVSFHPTLLGPETATLCFTSTSATSLAPCVTLTGTGVATLPVSSSPSMFM